MSKFGSAILPETWERLLCLLVGIADYLLRPEEGKSELGDIISCVATSTYDTHIILRQPRALSRFCGAWKGDAC